MIVRRANTVLLYKAKDCAAGRALCGLPCLSLGMPTFNPYLLASEYKLRILAEADACRHGELGELLRREKLYSSQLTTWRQELAENGVEKLHKTAPGPTPSKTPEQKRIAALERENARLQQRLSTAEDCLSLQKKALSMLDRMNTGH